MLNFDLIFGLNHYQDELYCDNYVKIFAELAKDKNGASILLAHLAANNHNRCWKHEWQVEKIIKRSVSSTRSAMFYNFYHFS